MNFQLVRQNIWSQTKILNKIFQVLTLCFSLLVFHLPLNSGSVFAAEEKEEDSNLMNTVITWGVGIASGASLLMCDPAPKPNDPSPASFYVFTAAGIAYFAIETFVSDKPEDNDPDSGSKRLREGDPASVQANSAKEALAKKEAEKEAKEKKAKYKQMAAAAMLGAAALALVEKLRLASQREVQFGNVVNSCTELITSGNELTSMINGLKTLSPTVAPAMQAKIVPQRALVSKNDLAVDAQINSFCQGYNGSKVLCKGSEIDVKHKEFIAKCHSVIGLSLGTVVASPQFVSAKCDKMNATNIEEGEAASAEKSEQALEQSKATEAVQKQLSSGGGQGDGLLAGLSGGFIGKWLNKAHYSPLSRTITYGVLGGIVMATAMADLKDAEKLDEEAQALRDLVDGFNKRNNNQQLENRAAANPNFVATDGGRTNLSRSGQRAALAGDPNSQCLIQGDPQNSDALVIDPECECRRTNSCAQVIVDAEVIRSIGFDSALLQGTSQAAINFSNSLSSGDTAGADLAGQTLLNNASAIRKLNRKLQKKLNAVRSRAGDSPLNFEKLQAQELKNLSNLAKKSTNNLSNLPAGLSSALAPSLSKKEAKKKAKEAVTANDTNNVGSFGVPNDSSFDFSDLDNDNGAESSGNSDQLDEEGATSVEYEVDTVNKNNGPPIWAILSKAYQTVGIKRLLKRKKKKVMKNKDGLKIDDKGKGKLPVKGKGEL
jgi:hypothetical protein